MPSLAASISNPADVIPHVCIVWLFTGYLIKSFLYIKEEKQYIKMLHYTTELCLPAVPAKRFYFPARRTYPFIFSARREEDTTEQGH